MGESCCRLKQVKAALCRVALGQGNLFIKLITFFFQAIHSVHDYCVCYGNAKSSPCLSLTILSIRALRHWVAPQSS